MEYIKQNHTQSDKYSTKQLSLGSSWAKGGQRKQKQQQQRGTFTEIKSAWEVSMGKRMGDNSSSSSSPSSSSCSSDAKRRRPRQYKDYVIMEAKFKRKFKKLKKKRKKDKEDIRILKEDLRILKESQEDLRVLKEDLRILKEGHQDLKSNILEMRKEGCAEVDHYKASTSRRSQLSQSARFRLVIGNRVRETIYKNETIETENAGGHLEVMMYDGGSPIAPDHTLASVKVDLVIIEGRFNDKRDSWSREEFERSIITPREGIIRLVKNGTFDLIGGRCDHQGAIIMDNSQKKEVKLGVMIAVRNEERVLEGVSNLFRVQEGKTKRSKKNVKQPSPSVPTQNSVQPTSTHATQHGQAINGNGQNVSQQILVQNLGQSSRAYSMQHEDCQPSYSPATMIFSHLAQALNGYGQNFSQHFPVQHDQDYGWPPRNDLQAAVNQLLPARGQDQCTTLPNGSSELAYDNPSSYELLNGIQLALNPEDVRFPNAQTQMQDTYETFCGRVVLRWDKPHMELWESWNSLDHLMPLYSTQSRFYGEGFPSTSLMDKAHKLLASISSVGSDWKMISSVTRRATRTPQKRGVLIRPIEPYNSDDEPPVKKQRNAKYNLRFVNRACYDYYTREQVKSEDGDLLKVALYDENNLVVTSGALSSACVEVVVLHGDFNAEGQDYWTSEEFSTCLVHPQSAEEPPALGGDPVLALTDGEADLQNVHFQTSSFHARTGKFKMGVVIKNAREASVQEGITSPFLVRVRLGEEQAPALIQGGGARSSSSRGIVVRGILDNVALVAQLTGLVGVVAPQLTGLVGVVALAARFLRIPLCEAECAKLEQSARRLRSLLQWTAAASRDPDGMTAMATGTLVEAAGLVGSYRRSTLWCRVRTAPSVEVRLRGMRDRVDSLCMLLLFVHANNLLTIRLASETSATNHHVISDTLHGAETCDDSASHSVREEEKQTISETTPTQEDSNDTNIT